MEINTLREISNEIRNLKSAIGRIEQVLEKEEIVINEKLIKE